MRQGRADLDAIATDRPIVVYASRGRVHINSAALTALGATRESTVISRVTVGKDASGEPDGVLSGSPAAVLNLMARVVPPPSLDEKKAIIQKVQAEQHAMGLTGIRELQIHPDVMRAYFELWRERALTLRTSIGLEVNDGRGGTAGTDAGRVGRRSRIRRRLAADRRSRRVQPR